MAVYADIIIDISAGSLDRVFQYRIPDALREQICPGSPVLVPFGNGNRQMKGYVIRLSTVPSYDVSRIKEILSVDGASTAAQDQMMQLAGWISKTYGATMIQALKTVLPVQRRVQQKVYKTYYIADASAAQACLLKARKNKREKARVRLLEALLEADELSRETVTGVLQISAATLTALIKTGAVGERSDRVYRQPKVPMVDQWHQVKLNDEQQQAAEGIWQTYRHRHDGGEAWQQKARVHLLHGITGSGKTEVYMELIDRTIAAGKQAIVLIPEISLTMQTVSRFYARFGSRIAILHSRLSAGERYDQYLRAKNGETDIMIGPRSALFTPFERLGLIVIDEEQEGAYKSETTPKYHARETAVQRAKMADALVVLGSATPSVNIYHQAMQGEISYHRLDNRARSGSQKASVTIVDLKDEFRLNNKGMFSRLLTEKIQERLDRHEQIMLFLNRRGYAGFVSCRQCGEVMRCPHCDVSLTLHNYGKLKCHYCGYEAAMPKTCPSCGSRYIGAFGTGTQKVEEMVRQAFPRASVLRMDKDTTTGKDNMNMILKTFAEHDADILVGTQMIVKGHDFPDVTLVGILAADLSMFSGDYMSGERTFQLLVQAAGRAGRGNKAGEVIIQTYQPEHYSIVTAAAQDYEAFYRQEILYRKMMQYPPETQMLVILMEGKDEQALIRAITYCKTLTDSRQVEGLVVLGPSSAYIARGKDYYRRVLYMKHQVYNMLVDIKDGLETVTAGDIRFKDIYVTYDFNPMTLY